MITRYIADHSYIITGGMLVSGIIWISTRVTDFRGRRRPDGRFQVKLTIR